MERRTFLKLAMAGGAAAALPFTGRARAQEATPAPADPGLLLVRWDLQRIVDAKGGTTTPDDPSKYTLQFLPDGSLAIGADCNRAFGGYTLNGSSLTIGPLASSRAMCPEGSISDAYLKQLEQVASYQRVADASDKLLLDLKMDGGQMEFAPVPYGVVWQWTEFQGGDGSIVTAKDPSRYTLEFLEDGSVLVQADCNSGRGDNKGTGSQLDLTVAMTLMACGDDSQDSQFLRVLTDAASWVIRDGKLAISLKMDSGIAHFQAVLKQEEPATPAAG